MSANNSNSFLYNKYNLRLIKDVIALAIKIEQRHTTKYKLSDYDLKHIVAYNCKGNDLMGSSANTNNPNRHFLMGNNHYEIYEVPKKTNDPKFKFTGEYLVVFRNIEFGYWAIGYMEHKTVLVNHNITEQVSYICFGEFDVSDIDGYCSIYCTRGEGKCCRGRKNIRIFDPDDVRKIRGYHTTRHSLAKKLGLTK